MKHRCLALFRVLADVAVAGSLAPVSYRWSIAESQSESKEDGGDQAVDSTT